MFFRLVEPKIETYLIINALHFYFFFNKKASFTTKEA